ncbi:MAG: hypothetical protein QMD85_03005 [Candidatus Aenigmarchaeota archaeon]|nr:hypothetical protein [Candidatus Aenigmarchaeota archaeon]MDI6722508.1 hypothetical protein [Candidatus Aenigmarchaeota archaeon]
MNYKRTLIILGAAGAIGLASESDAEWYDPSSWFSNDKKETAKVYGKVLKRKIERYTPDPRNPTSIKRYLEVQLEEKYKEDEDDKEWKTRVGVYKTYFPDNALGDAQRIVDKIPYGTIVEIDVDKETGAAVSFPVIAEPSTGIENPATRIEGMLYVFESGWELIEGETTDLRKEGNYRARFMARRLPPYDHGIRDATEEDSETYLDELEPVEIVYYARNEKELKAFERMLKSYDPFKIKNAAFIERDKFSGNPVYHVGPAGTRFEQKRGLGISIGNYITSKAQKSIIEIEYTSRDSLKAQLDREERAEKERLLKAKQKPKKKIAVKKPAKIKKRESLPPRRRSHIYPVRM